MENIDFCVLFKKVLFKGYISQKNLLNFSDEALINEYLDKKSQVIISEFYNRYGYMVYGVCLKYFRNKEDAEDATIQVFSQLPSKLINHQIVNFKGWFYTLTRNECLMEIRKRKGKEKETPFIEIANEYDDDDEFEIRSISEKWMNMLPELTMQLNSLQGKCVELFYLKNQSYQVISEGLNISIKEVKSHIQNGKRNLRIKIMQLNNGNE